MKIKVCGMREKKNIEQLVSLNPDFIGFIFFKQSKRYVGADFNEAIMQNIPLSIKKVGVFVNDSFKNIHSKIQQYNLNYVQLHGNETLDLCQQIKNTGCGVIKVFSVSKNEDLKCFQSYEKYCDFFLLDTKCDTYGGSGKKFNWNLLSQYNYNTPLILSGGIDSEDTAEIQTLQQEINISAIDINSRFETEPGLKNIQKIQHFFASLR